MKNNNPPKSLSEYTEEEFLDLIHEIDRANEEEPDHVLGKLLQYFCEITEHPSGTDLLYRPALEEQGEPENVLLIIKNGEQTTENLDSKSDQPLIIWREALVILQSYDANTNQNP